ncbi:Protein mono-ADP-ribosyltransferase PARP4 [Lamellibrachia satsuma]|nr:Protein mono-ADP-ribosyltransferase PARP4 [Lamellibrachia satsuma]
MCATNGGATARSLYNRGEFNKRFNKIAISNNKRPLNRAGEMNIFSGCQIALELGINVPFKKKQQLRKTITDNDGVVSFVLTKKCSHLVVDDRENASDTYKARTALKYRVPVVSLNFIDACLEAGRLLDADSYIAVGKTKAQEFGSGKIVAANTKSDGPSKRKTVQLQTVKVWQWDDNKAPQYDDSYQVAKSVVLVKKVKWKSLMVTKFCVLEIHVAPRDSTPGTDDNRYRVFTHFGELSDKDDLGQKEARFSEMSDGALDLFDQLYRYWTTSTNNYSKTREFLSPRIGSPKFRQMLCDYGMEQCSMSEEVSDLLEHIWQEAVGELDQTLRVPLQDIKADQIEKAEAVLVELKQALNKPEGKSAVERLSDEFYSHLPHKSTHQQPVNSKSTMAKKQDLCQLLKDMVSVSEATSWAVRSSLEAKYRALRCHIAPLSKDTVEYSNVMSLIETTPNGANNVSVVNIYALHRGVEEAVFNGNFGNKRLLFHASSVKNFVGILSRGLLKPKVVVDDFGGQKTDAGMLGSGIYFADDYSTWVKYSQPSNTKGTRMLLINEVSLGKCADCYKFDTELTAPPSGYSSVHGVRKTESIQSDFQDDEYAIYDTSQQRQRYLVEFTLPNDKVKGIISQSEEEISASEDISADVVEIGLEDVKDVVDPQSTVTSGLVSSSDAPVPLTSVHIRAKLVDLAAQVVVLQAYVNENNEPIEAKYVFPLGEMAVVCGFEAFINGKHVVGEVKEKQTAHREYKEAVAAGHGAYLMDQHEDLPDVFTVSVGNIPPKASVLIKITYVAELQVDGEKICFSVPSNVAPWSKQKAFDDVTQTGLTTVNVDKEIQNEVTIQVAIEMPFDIRSITCPTHRVRLKQTVTRATVEMAKNQSLDDGFQLWISLAQIHVPRMWVERHPDTHHEACMLTFYPEFDVVSRPDFEVVFLLDLSNSMDGTSLVHAKKLILLMLHHLPNKCTFNIVVFGTVFDELFPASRPKTRLNEEAARRFIQETRATMGNTEVLQPLHAYFLLGGGVATRNVFLLSDGHINAEELTMQTVRDNAPRTRLFTFAVGSTANRHLLRRLALAGAGAYEVFDASTKYKWEERVTHQLAKAAQPSLSSVSVSWQQFNSDAPPLQAPSHVTALFSGSRQVIYGFVPNCTQAELKAVIDNQEISTIVSTTELNITTGKTLHQLTARAAIRDWEEGILADSRSEHEIAKKNRKNLILQLSTKYSIVTQFTSFVAIEKREKGETFWGSRGPSIAELVQRESVDALEYVAWDDAVKPPVVQSGGGGTKSDELEKLELLCEEMADGAVTFSTFEKEEEEQQIQVEITRKAKKSRQPPQQQPVTFGTRSRKMFMHSQASQVLKEVVVSVSNPLILTPELHPGRACERCREGSVYSNNAVAHSLQESTAADGCYGAGSDVFLAYFFSGSLALVLNGGSTFFDPPAPCWSILRSRKTQD